MSDERIFIEDVISDLRRVQEFDPEELRQNDRLGRESDFSEAVCPAQRVVSIFKKLPEDAIDELTFQQKKQLQGWCKSIFNLFDEIKSIKLADGEFVSRRDELISQTKQAHDTYLEKLQPLISFAVARTVDFNALTSDARSAVQAIKDESAKIQEELLEISKEASNVLQQVKDAAAEQGVTQQAKYFSDEAVLHANASFKWLIASIGSVLTLFTYSAFTLFFPYLEFFTADTLTDAVQLTASKVLVFLVLTFSALQSVKVYSAHKHNEVTNRHRQNALMTYRTLAEAGGNSETKDVVLQYAASAIYTPNDSGYLKHEDRGTLPSPIVGLNTRALSGGSGQAE